ncbi:hypothetical protein ACHAQH_007835 [Verticillium albo-atrum]
MTAGNLRYDAEYQKMLDSKPAGPRPSLETIAEVRAFFEKLFTFSLATMPVAEDIRHTHNMIPTHDDAEIRIHQFLNNKTRSATSPQPAVLYFHGGGMISGSTDMQSPLMSHYVSLSGIPFFCVDYRLAPENPAPAAVEDAYTALKFLVDHATEWNVDPSRICLMGDSAGGLIATACALLARDRDITPKPAMQLLIYPQLDDRTKMSDNEPLSALMTHKPSANVRSWKMYLEGGEVSGYTVPARQENLAGLPRTYMEVGTLDLFLKEDLTYVSRLSEAGVEVELRVWAGLPHGFELAFGLDATKRAIESRVNALKRL